MQHLQAVSSYTAGLISLKIAQLSDMRHLSGLQGPASSEGRLTDPRRGEHPGRYTAGPLELQWAELSALDFQLMMEQLRSKPAGCSLSQSWLG